MAVSLLSVLYCKEFKKLLLKLIFDSFILSNSDGSKKNDMYVESNIFTTALLIIRVKVSNGKVCITEHRTYVT